MHWFSEETRNMTAKDLSREIAALARKATDGTITVAEAQKLREYKSALRSIHSAAKLTAI